MPRKAKKRVHPMPKLGWADQLLYWVAIIACFAGAVVSVFFPLYYREALAKTNSEMIAYTEGTGSLHFVWLFLLLFFVGLVICAGPYQHRLPVFGRKDIRYGPPAYPRVYPLLVKNKPKHWESPKAQARKKKLTWIGISALLASLLFCAAIYPRCLCGRYELLSDGTVTVYDADNRQTAHHGIKDTEKLWLVVTIRYLNEREEALLYRLFEAD